MTLLDRIDPISTGGGDAQWIDVCAYDDLVPDLGVGALVGGSPVAVFRCGLEGELHAVGNIDPFSGTSVLSRGIVGSLAGRAVVASPLFKQHFDLATGRAVEDPEVRIPVHPVRRVGDRVLVRDAPHAPEV